MTNTNWISVGLILIFAVTIGAGCAGRNPIIAPPAVYTKAGAQTPLSADQPPAMWLYVEVQDNVKEDTIKQIANLVETVQVQKPSGISTKDFLRQTYGTQSRKFQHVFLEFNPQLAGELNSRKEATLVLFGGPVFSKYLTDYQSVGSEFDEFSAYKYTLGNAYVKVRADVVANPGQLGVLSTKIRNGDSGVRELNSASVFTLIPTWGLTEADTECSKYSELESPPYASLNSWFPPPNYRERYQTVTIAVIDSGIALRKGVVKKEGDTNIESEDLDPRIRLWENGFVRRSIRPIKMNESSCDDDKYGCNFLSKDGRIEDISTQSPLYGHGTHIAGLCSGFSPLGSALPNDKIEIMVLKVTDQSGNITPANVTSALTYAINHNAKIVNISLIGPVDDGLLRIARDASSQNVLIIAAAGNAKVGEGSVLRITEKSDHYPARLSVTYDNVVTVGALDGRDQLADFSNRGEDIVTIAAPGVRVDSTLPDGSTGKRCGTSQAAPLVTVTAAMMLMLNPQFHPSDVKLRLQSSSDYESGLEGKVLWGGKLNMEKAVRLSEDLVETRQKELYGGIIEKKDPLTIDSTPLYWEEIRKINLGPKGNDRVLLSDWRDDRGILFSRYGKLSLQGVSLKMGDGTIKKFTRGDILDIVLKYHR